jgi:hypothetical protein
MTSPPLLYSAISVFSVCKPCMGWLAGVVRFASSVLLPCRSVPQFARLTSGPLSKLNKFPRSSGTLARLLVVLAIPRLYPFKSTIMLVSTLFFFTLHQPSTVKVYAAVSGFRAPLVGGELEDDSLAPGQAPDFEQRHKLRFGDGSTTLSKPMSPAAESCQWVNLFVGCRGMSHKHRRPLLVLVASSSLGGGSNWSQIDDVRSERDGRCLHTASLCVVVVSR